MPTDPAKTCPECGTELPAGTAPGQCPNCLLGLGLAAAGAGPGDEKAESQVQKSDDGDQSGETDRRGPGVGGQNPTGTSESADAKSQTATQFDQYELLEEIGRGGMGMVYKARQRSLDRIVALKLLLFGPHAPPESVKRFRAEAVATAALQHPNIVAIHEVGSHAGQHFLVMDFVEGRSLAKVISDFGFRISDFKRVAGYVKTIAEAIHYAHDRGILHRDLKPSNVLIDANDQPRVTDFGLAKHIEGDSELTVSGQVLGSPNYMPPEQATGKRGRVSRRSDVYALGAILYHALTGRPPFVGEGVAETVQQVLNAEPVSPRVLNPGVPADLETVCLKCLEKEPAKRYATAQLLAEELGRFLNGQPVLARPIGLAGKVWRWCRRKPLVASLAGAVVVTLLSGFAGVLWQWRQAEAERRRTEHQAYISDINAAHAALKANNPGRALELLNRHKPRVSSRSTLNPQPSTDLRGFEWRYLWQQCQTEDEAVFARLPSGIRSLEVSPDGRWLVAGSELGAVKLWNLKTQEEISLAPDGGVVSVAAISPDCARVVFSDQSLKHLGGFAVWNIQTRQREAPVMDEWPLGPVGFFGDGKLLGYSANGREVAKTVVADFATRQALATCKHLTAAKDNFRGLSTVGTPDGRYIIFSESDPDRRIGRWDWRAGSEVQYFPAHREPVTDMAVSPDGKTLATGAGFTETGIKLWEVPSFRLLADLVGHEGWVTSLKFAPDGQTLASGSVDRTIRLWDVPSKTIKRVFRGLPHEVWRVCFSLDGWTLFSGSGDGTIHRWSLDAPRGPAGFWLNHAALEPVGMAPNGKRFALALAPDGQQFAGTRNGAVYLGKAESAQSPVPLPKLGTNNLSLLFSSDGKSLFAGTRGGEVQVWSLDRHQLLPPLRLADQSVLALREDAQGHALVTAQWDAKRVFATPCRVGVRRGSPWQEQKSWTFPAAWPSLAISPDGRWLATGHTKGPVQVWSLTDSTGVRTLRFGGRISGVAFSPDGQLLAASSLEGQVKVWEMPRLRESVEFRAHPGAVRALAFSPEGRRLATAGEREEAVKLWDAVTWQELIALERPGESLQQIAFSADGRQLTALTPQSDVLCWRVPSWEEIEAKEKETIAP